MVQGGTKPAIQEENAGFSSASDHDIVPAKPGSECAIDLAHLARMTLGEKCLEAEVLALFDRQSAILLARMRGAPPQTAAALAHTLAGSARGVGAWEVAGAAEEVERAAARGFVLADTASAVRALERAVSRAQAAVKELLADR